jgi:hypothetical protein
MGYETARPGQNAPLANRRLSWPKNVPSQAAASAPGSLGRPQWRHPLDAETSSRQSDRPRRQSGTKGSPISSMGQCHKPWRARNHVRMAEKWNDKPGECRTRQTTKGRQTQRRRDAVSASAADLSWRSRHFWSTVAATFVLMAVAMPIWICSCAETRAVIRSEDSRICSALDFLTD